MIIGRLWFLTTCASPYGTPSRLGSWHAPGCVIQERQCENVQDGNHSPFISQKRYNIPSAIFFSLEAKSIIHPNTGELYKGMNSGRKGSRGAAYHSLPSGTQWSMSFPHATYTHALPRSLKVLSHCSISWKSRISSSQSGPGGDEAPSMYFLNCNCLNTVLLYL